MKKIQKLLLLYHTIKYVKFSQIVNRLLRRFTKVKIKKPEYVLVRSKVKSWHQPVLFESSFLDDTRILLLNEPGQINDWTAKNKSKLWLYNLHYFDFLKGYNSEAERIIGSQIIDNWIVNNPPIYGVGWEPYPMSLRIVNWLRFYLSNDDSTASSKCSLYIQTQALNQMVEFHLLGNHIIANAKALVFSGCFFEGEEADEWLKKGLFILDRELKEQILDDGANFELSPMYHNIILEDILDLINLSRTINEDSLNSRVSNWEVIASKMLSYASTMTHPDGDVSFFNDSAIGISPKLERLKEYARFLDVDIPAVQDSRVILLEDSGYVVAKVKDKKLIIDAAKVGPDYIPGHAHADTLSFELSIGKQRVLVNSGTSVYGLGEERLRQRKTEAHNSVVVDGEDSSEVWGGFRIARRAYPASPVVSDDGQVVHVECSHNGYMRLPGKVRHSRTWELSEDSLIISDKLTGSFNKAQAHYHFHPSIDILYEGDDIILQMPDSSRFQVHIHGSSSVVVDSTWHPEFGISIPNKKLIIDFNQNEVKFVLEKEL